MTDIPVVLLNGARQTGKTTLAQAIAAVSGAQCFTLDDSATLALGIYVPGSINLGGDHLLLCEQLAGGVVAPV